MTARVDGRPLDNQLDIRSVDGQRHVLRAGGRLIFGRPGGAAELLVRDDVHVSRHHGLLEVHPVGWTLTNVSTVNPLYVDLLDGTLVPLRPGGRWQADRERVALGTATMIHLERALRVRCSAVPPVAAAGAGLPPVTGEPTIPSAGVSLAEDAQYFLTAVLLCRPWLRDPLRIRRLPSATEIGTAVVALTGAAPTPGLEEELERFVVTDLKTLKAKMLDAGVFAERPVSAAMLAAALIGHGLVTPAHLAQVTGAAREWRYRWAARLGGDGRSRQ